MDGRAEQAVSMQCRAACCLQTAQRAAWMRTWKSSGIGHSDREFLVYGSSWFNWHPQRDRPSASSSHLFPHTNSVNT